MNKTRYFSLIFAVTTAAVGIYYISAEPDPRPVAESSPPQISATAADALPIPTATQNNSDPEELKKKLAALEKEMETLQSHFSLAAEKGKKDRQNTEKPNPRQMEAMSERVLQVERDYINTSFATNQTDPHWSEGARTQIATSFADIKQVDGVAVDCRSEICRVTGSVGPDANARDIGSLIGKNLEWKGQMYVNIDHASGQLMAFFAREGQNLPDVTASLGK